MKPFTPDWIFNDLDDSVKLDTCNNKEKIKNYF
jgi:hypothetical protein